MKTILYILLFIPNSLFAPHAEMSKQDMISAWEFQFLTQPFTPARLKTALEIFVDKPDVAFAQARLETGDFTSRIWIENRNAFGMHPPAVRETYSIGENRKCAVYRHWFYSVLDYKLMQDYYYSLGHDHEYFMSVYCPHPEYKQRVNNLI
jgi:uncharacterized FlgJ-related protein